MTLKAGSSFATFEDLQEANTKTNKKSKAN